MNPDQMPVNDCDDDFEQFREHAKEDLKERINLFIWQNCNPNWTIKKAENVALEIYDLLTADLGER